MGARSNPRSDRNRPQTIGVRRTSRAPDQKPLYVVDDHGAPVTIAPDRFALPQRGGGWGPFAESFARLNGPALAALDVGIEAVPSADGVTLRLVPGGRAGAIPLRSAQTGHVVAGLLVQPRFGWVGIGRVLAETGWHAAPEFLDLSMVPGSGREVPPWVLAGPVLVRLEALLRSLRRGYHEVEEVLRRPRGRILWDRYRAESLVRGRWDQVPCRFSDLDLDPMLRREVRWTLERLHRDLNSVGGTDPIALMLGAFAHRLLDQLADVAPMMPRRDKLRHSLGGDRLLQGALRRGIEAMAWVVEERGLGGGRELDGLAWALPLERLWENYVEAVIRREAVLVGGEVKVGRRGETTFPLYWTDPMHRSLGHLVPDIVVRRSRSICIVDAKYKAHLAELDEVGWRRFTEETREAHRADLHQVLAYAALYDMEDITATLVFPLRQATWEALRRRGRDVSVAELFHGGRRVRVELRGLPFGTAN